MVFKRYIKRNGKVYGPYIYHNRKVNGKVISEYRGKGEVGESKKILHKGSVTNVLGNTKKIISNINNVNLNKFNKRFLLIPLGIIFVLIFGAFLFNFVGNLTGQAVLNVEEIYSAGDSVDGIIKLTIDKDEFVPAQADVFLNLSSSSYSYILKNLISDSTSYGNYSVNGLNLDSAGEGYGVVDSEGYPLVDFVLEVYYDEVLNVSEETNLTEELAEDEEVLNETIEIPVEVNETVIETNETIENNETEEIEQNVTEIEQNDTIIEPTNESEELPETPVEVNETEEVPEIPAEELIEEPVIPEIPEETPSEESIISEEPSKDEVKDEKEAEKKVKEEAKQEVKEETPVETPVESSPAETPAETNTETTSEPAITGSIIKNILYGITRVYLSITGKAVESTQIEASVSYDEPYEYKLEQGQSVRLVYSTQNVWVEVKNKKVIVTTDYTGKDSRDLIIDLKPLNIPAETGTLDFAIYYNGTEIVKASKRIEVINNTLLNWTIFNETIINTSITTLQYNAVIGKPVKWAKIVQVDENQTSELKVNVHKNADKINIKKFSSGDISGLTEEKDLSERIEEDYFNISFEENVSNSEESYSITGNVIGDIEIVNETIDEVVNNTIVQDEINEVVVDDNVSSENIEQNVIIESNNSINNESVINNNITVDNENINDNQTSEIKEVIITPAINSDEKEIIISNATLLENSSAIEINYETPAPISIETQTKDGKQIIVSSETHYENILAYTLLENETKSENVKLYNVDENGTKIPTIFESFDLNNNSLADIVFWIVPHLSNETYQIIIEISKAEHLDTNRTFISDIYDSVKALDGNYSEPILNNEYVRVTFPQPLDNTRDVTFYAIGSGNIELYERDGNELIGSIEVVGDGTTANKILLADLEGTQDIFDLKVINSDESGLEFDYIVDPYEGPGLTSVILNSTNPATNDTNQNLTVYSNFAFSLSAWNYRKSITINNGAGATITNYPLKFIVNRSSGTDSGFDVYVNGRCAEDYDDIRFTTSDGSTLLDYWIESIGLDSATIWVEVNSLAAGANTFYLYYNNSVATAVSNSTNTFPFFDDFSGASIDTAKWQGNTADASISGGIVTMAASKQIYGQTFVAPGMRLRTNVRFNTANGADLWGVADSTLNHHAIVYYDTGTALLITKDGTTQTTVATNPTVGAFVIGEVIVNGSTNVRTYQNGTQMTNSPKTTNLPTAALTPWFRSGGTTKTISVDWVFISQYNSSEPSVSAWGSESSSGSVKKIIDWKLNGNSYAVLNMPFENGTGTLSTFTKDYSNWSNNGTVQGPTWNATGGVDGRGAYMFDGKNDLITLANSSSLNITRNFTITLWFKTNMPAVYQTLYSKTASGPFTGLYLGKIFIQIGGDYTEAGNSVSDTGWHFVAFTHNGTTAVTYLDGVKGQVKSLGAAAISIPASTIGATEGSAFFNGTIDDVVVYNKTLSIQQIKALYANQTNIIVKEETEPWQNWTACVTPNDAGGDGTEVCSNSLMILGNYLPTQTQPILNSTNSASNDTNQNLTIYNQTTEDFDLNVVKNIIDWKLNNHSISTLLMPFEGGSTSTLTRDYSNSSNNGTVSTAIWNATGGVDGKGAYEFNGKTDYITLANNVIVNEPNRTVCFWIKPAFVVTAESDIFTLCNAAGTTYRGIWQTNRVINYGWSTSAGNSRVYTTGNILTAGVWHHFCIANMDNKTVSIYFNGVNQTTTLSSAGTGNLPAAQTAAIGRAGAYTASAYFNGTIDDIVVYNKTLTVQQVQALYNNRTDLIVAQETSAGDVWSGCVIPNDGANDGLANCSNSLTIIGVAPTQTQPILNSTNPLSNNTYQNLTVYNQTTYDFDEESVKNIIDWRLNGSSIAVLNMPFEGGSLSGDADGVINGTRDYSSFMNNGTVYNATWVSNGGYDGRGAYTFNGRTDSIRLINTSIYRVKNISFCSWIKPTTVGTRDTIINSGNADAYATNNYIFGIGTSGRFTFYGRTPASQLFSNSNAYSLNVWTHACFVSNGTSVIFYSNGTYAGVVHVVLGTDNTFGEQIGVTRGIISTLFYFNGTIDEALLFNRSLSANEILALYNNRTDLMHSDETLAGDNWSACITPNDGVGDGLMSCSNDLIISSTLVPANLTIINPLNNSNFNLTSVEFNVSASASVTGCNISIDDNTKIPMTAFSTTYYNYTNSTMLQGNHNFTIECLNDTIMEYSYVYGSGILVDTIYPDISYDATTTANNSNVTTLIINYTTNDTNDNYVVNNLDNSVVGWWRFENGYKDEMGKNNGTGSGNPTNTSAGKFGKGISLVGMNNQYVNVGTNIMLTLNTSSQFTISSWFKPTMTNMTFNSPIAVGNPENLNGKGFGLSYVTGNQMRFTINNGTGAGNLILVTVPSLLDNWHNFLVVVNRTGNATLYLDGNVIKTGSISATGTQDIAGANPLLIGRYMGTSVFNGSIDDVIIFNRTLTAAEISSLYNASATKYYRNFAGNLTDGTHTFTGYVVDKGGNKNATDMRTVTVDNSYPDINFTDPTPANETKMIGNSAYINLSVSDSSPVSTFIDWNNSLVGWWRMEQGNGSYFEDYKGVNNGTCATTACPSYTGNGVRGGGYVFDGVNDLLKINDNSNLNPSYLTISSWIKPTLIGGDYQEIVRKFNTTSNRQYDLAYSNLNKRVELSLSFNGVNTNVSINTGTNSITESKWYHIIATFNGSDSIIYLDSLNKSSNHLEGSIFNGVGPLGIGCNAISSSDRVFNGTIDDVQIYNRALSPEEVVALYNSSLTYHNFTDLSDGNYTYKAYAQDIAGNLNLTEQRILTIDTVAPSSLAIIVPLNNSNYNSSSVEFNVSSNEALSWCGLSIDAEANETMTAFNTTYYNYTNSTMTQGYHNIRITCNDTSNNYASNITQNILVDIIYPDISYDATTSGNLSSVRDLIVNISTSDINDNYVVNNLDNSVVGWWRFEGNYFDEMGLNNGTGSGNPTNTSAGKFGKGVVFDGKDDVINVVHSSSIDVTNYWTISAWVKRDVNNIQHSIVEKYDWTGGRGSFVLRITSGNKLQAGTINGTTTVNVCSSTSNIDAGTWYFVSATYNYSASDNKNTINCYVNGISQRNVTASGGIPSSSLPLRIGALGNTGTASYFNGSIDDVIIFNRSLSASEISSLYNASATKYYRNFSGALTDGTHTFTGYVVDKGGNKNQTDMRTVTVDNSYPQISIISPLNNTNTSDINLDVNYTYSELNVGSCWYSNDSMSLNYSLDSCSTNITNITWAEGPHNVTVYVNDTANNVNSTSVSFRIDTTSAGLTIIVPVNNSNYNSSSVEFNVSSNEALSWCGLSIDAEANETMTSFNTTYYNYTNATMEQGSHNIRITCNDTSNNYNSSVVNNILVDTIYPDISYDAITTANNSNVTTLIINYTTNDTNDNYVVNNLDNSILGLYRFESGNGTLISSEVGLLPSGNTTNNPTWTQAGRFGKGFIFNGVNQSIYLGTPTYINNISWSVGGWTYRTPSTSGAILSQGGTSSGSAGFHLVYAAGSTNKMLLYYYKVGTAGIQSSLFNNATADSRWYHVLVVYNGTDFIRYLNGGLDGSTNLGGVAFNPLPGGNMRIGSFGNNNGAYWGGTLDEIIIVNRSLSASEIQSLYNSSATKYNNNFTNLASGTHTFTGYVVDKGGNLNRTDMRTVNVDTSYPTLNITSPINNTNWSTKAIEINYTYTELNKYNCWYTNNSGIDNYTLTCGNNITGVSWLEGVNNITIYMNDSAGNVNYSSVMFYVDTIAPYFTNLADQNIYDNQSLSYDINASDDGVGIGSFSINWTELFNITSADGVLRNLTNLSAGNYYINVSVNDTLGNLNSSVILVNVSASVVAVPVVSLITPADAYSSTTTTTDFTYNVTDASSANCSLIINGVVSSTDLVPDVTGLTNTFASVATPVGSYTWNVNCTDNLNNVGNSSSGAFTITSSVTPVTPPTTKTSSGGGGGGSTTPSEGIQFNVNENYEKTIVLNRVEDGEISVSNNYGTPRAFNVRVTGLDGIINIEESSFSLEAGESKDLKFRVSAPAEAGVYVGKIIITSNGASKETSVIINVKTEKSLFDITLSILNPSKKLVPGEILSVQYDLLQMGIREKMDVTLKYEIKDFSGKVYVTQSETIAVENQKTLTKEFPETAELPEGEYVLATQLIYADGVAVASSQFKIESPAKVSKSNYVLIGLVVALVLVAGLMGFAIHRRNKALKKLKRE